MKNLSDWLCDLTLTNIDGDDITTVERGWYIFHRTPGHIVIFLDLFSEELSKRIQYPFKKPENWKNRLLRHANWKETRINMYDELVIETRTGGTRIVLKNTCKDPLTLAKNCF